MIVKVLDWFGFGPHGRAHDHNHVPAHTHGVVNPTIATTDRGIWAIKWSFLIIAATAALQLVVVYVSHSVALLADTIHNIADAGYGLTPLGRLRACPPEADADLIRRFHSLAPLG